MYIKMIYEHSSDNKARYSLGKEGNNMLITIGVNPSTATDEEDDRTKTKIKNFSIKNGFDGWLILNLYPQRATKPDNLDKEINPKYYQENLKEIKKRVSERDNSTIWAAWGNSIEKRKYLIICLKKIYTELKKFNVKWIHIGKLTKKGHPRHPSRLAYDSPIIDFDIVDEFDNYEED